LSCSPYSSTELEVAFKSPALGVLTMYNPLIARTSRVLNITTGDSCCNYAMGALKGFPLDYYNSALTPIFKFIDVTEIVNALLFSLANAMQQYFRQYSDDPDVFNIVTAGFGCTYTQFFIMVLQQLKWMFSDSQCLAQFLCPQTSTGGFQSFLCGSNVFPKGPGEIMLLPTFLNENLRMLKMSEHPYYTKGFSNSRNKIKYIPVLGTFKGYVPPTYFGPTINGVFRPYFIPESDDPNTPNIFDGTSGNYVVDFNETPLMSNLCALWNAYVVPLTPMFGSVIRMGGEANGGPLLQYTRYCQFVVDQHSEVPNKAIIPVHMRSFIQEIEVEKPVLEKKSSKSVLIPKEKEIKRIMAPPNSTLYTQYSLGYSGILPITSTFKENVPDFILPVIEIVPGALPGITQYQTAVKEPYSLLFQASVIYNNRATELQDSVPNNVVGLAGHKTALAEYVETLSRNNEGGFLGDLFTTIGNVASAVGIPEVGAVASTLGGVARGIGL